MLAEARSALHSLALQRLRAALSTLGVVLGVVTFVILLGLGEGAKRQALGQIEQLGTRNVIVRAGGQTAEQVLEARRRGSAGLALADGERLREAVPSITRWSAVREVPASVAGLARGAAPQVIATGPELIAVYRVELDRGRFITEDDVRSRSLVCVVGEDVARRLGPDAQAGGTLRIQESPCRVVGVLRRPDRRNREAGAIAARDFDNAVLVPIGAETAFAAQSAGVTEIVAQFRRSGDVAESLPLVRRTLAIAHRGVEDYQLIAPQELLRQAERARRSFNLLIGSIALVSLLAGGVGIMSAMLANVSERTREIGIRRALGATRRDIARQFFAEAAVLTALGAAVGLAIGLVALVIAALLGWPVAVSVWALGAPVTLALVVGCACTVYPALAAARLDPVEALRHA